MTLPNLGAAGNIITPGSAKGLVTTSAVAVVLIVHHSPSASTVALADAAAHAGIDNHVGIKASVDTFFEGQERSTSSANPRLLRKHRGMVDEYDEGELIEAALGSISYPYREILVLRHIEDMSVAEITKVLGIGTSAVKMRLLRARQEFRVAYAGHYSPP